MASASCAVANSILGEAILFIMKAVMSLKDQRLPPKIESENDKGETMLGLIFEVYSSREKMCCDLSYAR
jgi:hypothetical protein